jgi:hypothetical protein
MLLEPLKDDSDLTALNLSSCDVTSAGRFPFCNALSERFFNLFDISGNTIEADGAEYVWDPHRPHGTRGKKC